MDNSFKATTMFLQNKSRENKLIKQIKFKLNNKIDFSFTDVFDFYSGKFTGSVLKPYQTEIQSLDAHVI